MRPDVILGIALIAAALGQLVGFNFHEKRIAALEAAEPVGTVTIIVPADLRKLPCVPLQYLLSNRRISKIHSYSKDLKICEKR